MARAKSTSKMVESSYAEGSQPNIFFNAIATTRINIGRIIFQEVHKCADKNAGNLNLPYLILTLCEAVNVPLGDAEDVTLNNGGITQAIFVKLRGAEFVAAFQHH
ncbi:hypothetical protein PVK06_011544 [Gossypium arboreum]|uniref:Uncharacterized protein n=1 Tax=Gossypium arboreum TaxID=29729 RepID=A0ABR0Q9V0_GOSAR|nr:hypothetical protein PVK06_011544 [Gossypium arboreum]